MNFKDYQNKVLRTMKFSVDRQSELTDYSFGLIGETGETIDIIKKDVFHKHKNEELVNKLKGELGDVLWYLTAITTLYGLDIEDIAEHNIEKLNKRYPNGFSVEDSIKRVDVTEDK